MWLVIIIIIAVIVFVAMNNNRNNVPDNFQPKFKQNFRFDLHKNCRKISECSNQQARKQYDKNFFFLNFTHFSEL